MYEILRKVHTEEVDEDETEEMEIRWFETEVVESIPWLFQD